MAIVTLAGLLNIICIIELLSRKPHLEMATFR
jgi:hypothetical protein